MDDNELNISECRVVSWNMRGLSCALPYVNQLLNNNDICVLTEHHLFECELYKLNDINYNYDVYGKACNLLDNNCVYTGKGFGGVAILWKKSLSNNIQRCLNLGDDRICVIKLCVDNNIPLYIIGVYLPQRDCTIALFDDYLYNLEYVVERCQQDGNVVVTGDFNCHFGAECGPRGWGKTTSNANKLRLLCERRSLSIADLQSIGTGPAYSFHVDRVGTSYIDHCLVSLRLFCKILSCEVLNDHILNTSDHLALRITIDIDLPQIRYCNKNRVAALAWNRLSDSEIHELYTVPLEHELSSLYSEYVSAF
jgi:exonuclease III